MAFKKSRIQVALQPPIGSNTSDLTVAIAVALHLDFTAKTAFLEIRDSLLQFDAHGFAF